MRRWHQQGAILALVVICGLTLAGGARADFSVAEVHAREESGMLVMDARIDYDFSERAQEALDNGVPLTVEVHVQLRGAADWVWNESLVDQRLRYVIRYKPLSERYLVAQLPSDGGVSYVTRDAAISALGEIRGLQLASLERLNENDKPLEIHVKVSLDIEELPIPLKPIAYLFPSWKLSSGWTKWPLAP